MQTSVNDGKYVFVYRNIKNHTYSIKDVKTGLVIDRLPCGFFVENAKLIVSKAGRERVLKEKVKNVHAGVRGYLRFINKANDIFEHSNKVQLYYNPYKCSSFRRVSDESSVKSCDIVLFNTIGIFEIAL